MAIKKLVIKPTATTMNYGVRTAHIYKGFSSAKASQNLKLMILNVLDRTS
jgi:hypothetical protein